jgi:hypothetical protein
MATQEEVLRLQQEQERQRQEHEQQQRQMPPPQLTGEQVQFLAAQVATHIANQGVQQAGAYAADAAMHAVTHGNLQRELAKAYKPERFSLSRKDTQKITNFLYRTEKYFKLLGVTDDRMKVELATFAFDGDIAVWWRSRFEGQNMPWEAFRARMTERWCDENDMLLARHELRNLRQTGSATAATNLFDSLCLRIPGITDEEKRDRYMTMLKPHIQKELLVCEGLDTYEKLAHKATYLDNTLYRFRRAHSSTNAPSNMELGLMEGEEVEEGHAPELGVMAHDQRAPNGRFKRDLSKVKCYNCQEMGHLARDCPKKPKGHPNGRAQSAATD